MHSSTSLNVSGLEVNPRKSQIVFAGIDTEIDQQLLEITSFLKGLLPFRYLGLPVKPQMLNRVDNQLLIERVTTKIK